MSQEIIHGDCLNEMRMFTDNHFSGIVTDPPYGLQFMGKQWDQQVPGKEYWREMLRICKPGSFLLAFGGTRTYHRLACAIEDAGWEIRDCLQWVYASGFPKSHNHFGIEGFGTALKPAYEPILLCMKPCDGTFAQNAEKWGQAGINIDGCRIGTNEILQGSTVRNDIRSGNFGKGHNPNPGDIPNFKQSSNGRWPANVIFDEEAGKMLDEMSGNLGKSQGTQKSSANNLYGTYGPREIKKIGHGDTGGASRFFFIALKDKSGKIDACELQEELSLYGKKTENENNNQSTALYGNEPTGLFLPDTISIIEMGTLSIMIFPIFNASKPELIGTCTLESEKNINKLMVLNIESVNIAENGECLIRFLNAQMEPIKAIAKNVPSNDWLNGEIKIENIGTNITEKDERKPVINTIKNTLKSIERKSTQEDVSDTQNLRSRFFYCAKASSSERGEENRHPTVKPLKLMEYLLKLISPPKDSLILDPFAGSGTTLLAAKNLGISCVGIEKEEAYCEIIRGRLDVKQLDFMEKIA